MKKEPKNLCSVRLHGGGAYVNADGRADRARIAADLLAGRLSVDIARPSYKEAVSGPLRAAIEEDRAEHAPDDTPGEYVRRRVASECFGPRTLKTLETWLAGLALPVPFENWEILEHLAEVGYLPADASEEEKDCALLGWFPALALALRDVLQESGGVWLEFQSQPNEYVNEPAATLRAGMQVRSLPDVRRFSRIARLRREKGRVFVSLENGQAFSVGERERVARLWRPGQGEQK